MTSISFLLSALAVLVGSAVYGSLGFGFAFVVIPVLSRVDPTMLPPTLWLLGIPFAVALLRREPGHADVPRAAYITAGKLVGTPVGAALITLVPKGRLDLVFAVALLAAHGPDAREGGELAVDENLHWKMRRERNRIRRDRASFLRARCGI